MLNIELLTVGAAAEELGVTRQTIRNRITAGTLQAVTVRGNGGTPTQYLVTADEVKLAQANARMRTMPMARGGAARFAG